MKTRLILDVVIGALGAVALLAITFLPSAAVQSSRSMQHSESGGGIGTLDFADTVFLRSPASDAEVESYVEGRASGYRAYGDYGDVIAFQRIKGSAIILHRAMVHIQANTVTGGWDVPEVEPLAEGVDWERQGGGSGSKGFVSGQKLVLHRVGPASNSYAIEFVWFPSGKSGFLTKGDNPKTNSRFDQATGSGIADGQPISGSALVGIAGGELPCVGVVRVPAISAAANPATDSTRACAVGILFLALLIPLLIDFSHILMKRRREKRAGNGSPLQPVT